MIIMNAFAQGTQASNPSILSSLVPLFLVFGIFYFLVIAPQRKKQKQHEMKINALTRGAKIITGGGFYATVQRVIDNKLEVVLEGDQTIAVITRSSVTQIFDEEPETKPKTTPKKPKAVTSKVKTKAGEAKKAEVKKAGTKKATAKTSTKEAAQ